MLAAPAAGGAIDMSSSGGDFAFLESGTRFGAAIHGFGSRDTVEFEAVAYDPADKPVYANGIVKIETAWARPSLRSTWAEAIPLPLCADRQRGAYSGQLRRDAGPRRRCGPSVAAFRGRDPRERSRRPS